MEIAISNVPEIDGSVVVCPDVSGSMGCSVTGWQSRGSASKVRCVDVAALVAASFLRRNPRTTVLPFECDVVNLQLNPRDSVMTNATRLAGVGGGGTNCSAPLQRLNERKAHADLVIYVSDNESWMDSRPGGRGTATLRQWDIFKHRNPKARLVCIDLTPNTTTQAPDRKDILNIGGFSDNVFDLIASFAKDGAEANHWVRLIESIPLKTKMKTA
jgi:60 kDa SS-A/Ro ribonucleoprotein